MYNNSLQKYLSPNVETELCTIAFYKYKQVSPNILTEESSFAKNVLKDIYKKNKKTTTMLYTDRSNTKASVEDHKTRQIIILIPCINHNVSQLRES